MTEYCVTPDINNKTLYEINIKFFLQSGDHATASFEKFFNNRIEAQEWADDYGKNKLRGSKYINCTEPDMVSKHFVLVKSEFIGYVTSVYCIDKCCYKKSKQKQKSVVKRLWGLF